MVTHPRLNILLCVLFIQFHHIHSKEHAKVKSADVLNLVNNNPSSTWKADDYGLKEYDVEVFKKTKLGAIIRRKEKNLNLMAPEQMIRLAKAKSSENDKLPESFTWVDKGKTSCPIGNIRDQSNCGSCWAVATAAALSDRFCVQTKGKLSTPLSHEYFISCDSADYGCDGGLMNRANNYTMKVGLITGGEYESDVGCQPYSIMPCQFPTKKPCAYSSARTPKCRGRKCTNEWYQYKVEPEKNVFKTKKWWFVLPNSTHSIEEIARLEIMNNGPITASFAVPYDFLFYKTGVYVPPQFPRYVGGHAVRVVGWGVEKGLKYWLAANSWTTEWGEDGFFKIIRGVNACFFEDELSVLVPLINK